MRSLIKNTKGAVTVFVTLLLIPAILVSGTAVDLARIHTARSIVQDANQLAANSVLTQYNALLYDIYGLMGVAQDDPILFALLDEYISVSVFGEAHDRSMGTLQVLYGSDLSMEEVDFGNGRNLRNEDILRRQIEEYMKFRGPVLIVKEFLEAFDNNTLGEDAEIIGDKLEIDSDIAEMYDKYKELYEAIVAADKCTWAVGGIAGGSFGAMSSRLQLIRDQFVDLKRIYSDWENATESSLRNSISAHYDAILQNIVVYTVGGRRGFAWSGSEWLSYSNIDTGLNTSVENAKQQADDFKVKFDAVVNIARELDAMNSELSRKIDELERKVNEAENEELRRSFTEASGNPPMSVIESYRNILRWNNISAMASAFSEGGYSYIDNTFKPMLDEVGYRNSDNPGAGSLTRPEMAALTSYSRLALMDSVSASSSLAAVFAGFPRDKVTYHMPPGFLKFAEHPGENREFFEALTAMMSRPALEPVRIYDEQENSTGSDGEERQRNIISDLLDLVETAYTGLSNNYLGAGSIEDSDTASLERMGMREIVTLIPQALSDPVLRIIQDPLGSLQRTGDYLLLLTYGASMFSNYTTTRPESIGMSREELSEIDFPKTPSGVPISPEVNYFFQSEWEYLYSGHDNAGQNLNAITRLLFLVRLVCNYITVFSVNEVTSIVNSIRSAFSWNPILGLILGELARAAFVAAESLIDVASLRTGHKVPIIKSVGREEWVCSPRGVKNAITNLTANSSADGGSSNNERGITYSNYMILFFTAKSLVYLGRERDAATELAKRVGNLIEWNMINYTSEAGADEARMAEAIEGSHRFRLVNMKTDFSITTTVNMRMLFLSLPLAQNYFRDRGIGMQGTMPISVTDYRGY